MILVVVKKYIHGGFYRSGGIRSRGVAVDPTLGMHDIGDRGAGTANGKFVAAAGKLAAFQILNQGFDFVLTVHHEFNVVASREA